MAAAAGWLSTVNVWTKRPVLRIRAFWNVGGGKRVTECYWFSDAISLRFIQKTAAADDDGTNSNDFDVQINGTKPSSGRTLFQSNCARFASAQFICAVQSVVRCGWEGDGWSRLWHVDGIGINR